MKNTSFQCFCFQNNILERTLKFPVLLEFVKQAALSLCVLQNANIIHRDIAARNYLVDEHKNVKLSDFGMARTIQTNYYTASMSAEIAIRWSAPEVLQESKFSINSDLYSFGVTMWEIFMKGAQPFAVYSNKV